MKKIQKNSNAIIFIAHDLGVVANGRPRGRVICQPNHYGSSHDISIILNILVLGAIGLYARNLDSEDSEGSIPFRCAT